MLKRSRLFQRLFNSNIMSSNQQKSTFVSVRKLDTNETKYVKPVLIEYDLDGKKRKFWEGVLIHDSVAIILYNKTTKKLVFVKQFRPAVMMCSLYNQKMEKREKPFKSDGYTLELCAGIIDKEGKSVTEIAKEEILEEVGFDVDINKIQLITSYRSHNGISGAMQYLFFAELDESQRISKGGGIDDESIEVIELSVEECKNKVLNCLDEDAIFSRSGSLLMAINWVIYEYLPKQKSK